MTVTKISLSGRLCDELGFNRQEAKSFVDDFFEELKKTLESNESVKLSGFGSFDLRDKKSRPGRNPKTGKGFVITARRVVTFKVGQRLKERINQNIK